MEPAAVPMRLAAILAADVAGYSRLMAEDEEGTLRTLSAYRTAISEYLGWRPKARLSRNQPPAIPACKVGSANPESAVRSDGSNAPYRRRNYRPLAMSHGGIFQPFSSFRFGHPFALGCLDKNTVSSV